MQLYTYWRSSTAYRVRIALGLKGLAADMQAVNLLAGEQRAAGYRALNPQAGVPTLVDDDGTVLTQSLAIIEYLDETRPTPPLLPADPVGRARVRALAHTVAMEIHPLGNLRVLQHLTGALGLPEAAKADWYRHWMVDGLATLEALLAGHPATGTFCHGESPGLADICLVPALYGARRFAVELAPYPTVERIDAACRALPAFQAAAPENQSDAP